MAALESGSGMPRWVKVFGIVAVVVAVLLVVMLLTGHGPGSHMSGALVRHCVLGLSDL